MGGALDVVVVGNIGVDTNIYPASGDPIDLRVESYFTENLDCVGQAGGYCCRGYARLGWRTGFVGAVGEDPAGRAVRETLAREGVDQAGVFVDPAGTSRSVNLMHPDGRRRNFYDGKSHMTLEPDLGRCAAVLGRARFAHFHLPNWARRLLPGARARGMTVACDLQDVVTLDDGYRRDFIEAADILFFSAVNCSDPTPLVRELLAGRPSLVVVVGMGARGCALGHGREPVRFFPPVADERPVTDTNGAGDSLAVGFLSSYVLERRPLDESIRRGQIAARHACTLRGTSDGLIDAETLERRAAG